MENIEINANGEYDFYILYNGRKIANVWYSDKSEWSVYTTDGPCWTKTNKQDAIDSAINWGKVQYGK